MCTPTRAQFVTGRYQIRYGMQHGGIRPDAQVGVPLTETLVSNALKTCGYNTELIGKWHLGFYREEYCPQHRGFDHFVGFYTGSEDFYVLVQNLFLKFSNFFSQNDYEVFLLDLFLQV